MHVSRISLIGAFVALALTSPVRGQSIESIDAPKEKPSKAKQDKDESECRLWANLHTGFDPEGADTKEAPTPKRSTRANPVLADPLMPGARREQARLREDMARKRRDAQRAAETEKRASYDREYKTCLDERRRRSTAEPGQR